MDASVTEIFEKYPVEEIRKICIEIRNDVENKKMELRFLVGERHRDVIEASDNILRMRDFSHSVTEKLTELEECCIYKTPISSTDSLLTPRQSRNPRMLIAAQLKLLLDIPEMIWSSLDCSDLTGAVEFFLLGRHLSVKMQLTGETSAAHVNAQVLVKRQWAALDHIESTIAAACRKQLALPTIPTEMIAEALTALLVLEDLAMSVALDEFLAGRMAALRQILESDKVIVDECLKDVVRLLTQTATSVSQLFVPSGQVAKLLHRMLDWSPQEAAWFVGENLFEYLPETVASYRLTQIASQSRQPKSPSSPDQSEALEAEPSGIRAVALDLDSLQTAFAEWWQKTLTFCQKHLSALLSSHLHDLADLVETRQTLMATLDEEHPPSSDLWTDLFQPLFLEHFQVLLKSSLDEVYEEFETKLLDLAKTVDEEPQLVPEEADLASFVWSQGVGASTNQTDGGASQTEAVEEGEWEEGEPIDNLDAPPSELVLVYFACLCGRRDLLPRRKEVKKKKGETTSGGLLPGPLRWRLSRLLETAASISEAFDRTRRRPTTSAGESVVASRQQLNAQWKLVTPRLKRICSSFNNRLAELVARAASKDVATWKVLLGAAEALIERLCGLLRRQLASQSVGPSAAFCVARGCFCLVDTAFPALGATVVSATARLLTPDGLSEAENFTAWSDVAKLRSTWLTTSRPLRSLAAELALSATLRGTVGSATLEHLFSRLKAVSSDAQLTGVTSQWHELELKSEGGGAEVRLKVPSHPSWPLQETLLSLVRSLASLGVHSLPRRVAGHNFGLRLAEALLDTYRRLVVAEGPPSSQPLALQLLFDVRFLLRLLVWPLAASAAVEEVSALGQELVRRLEEAVDPFDVEMSSEQLDAAISQALRASYALYALLLPPNVNASASGDGKNATLPELALLALTPSSKALEGSKSKAENSASFGLLAFSLAQVRPPPQVAPMSPKAQRPLERTKTGTRAAASDFSWFSGLSFS